MAGLRPLLRWLVLGRPDGFRARVLRRFGVGRSQAARPESGRPTAPKAAEAPKSVNAPPGFEVVLHKGALKPGEITEVIVAGTAVAVANVGGTFFAMSNVCPHAGGPIGDGALKEHTVTCPYHGWSYDVRDGKCFVNADVKLPTYAVQIVGDAVCVRVP